MHRILILSAFSLLISACGEKASSWDDINSIDVTFPNGAKITAESMRQEIDLQRGLMFRDSLAPVRTAFSFASRQPTRSSTEKERRRSSLGSTRRN